VRLHPWAGEREDALVGDPTCYQASIGLVAELMHIPGVSGGESGKMLEYQSGNSAMWTGLVEGPKGINLRFLPPVLLRVPAVSIRIRCRNSAKKKSVRELDLKN
jgi:hypothetical protein